MTLEETIKIAKGLDIKYQVSKDKHYIVLDGINGQSTILYLKHPDGTQIDEQLPTFAEHLKQMGRDSLKMDLEKLLSITKHN